jgi:hypothetical protein
VAYTYSALSSASTLKLYNNGVLVATSGTLAAGSTATTLNLQGAV